MVARDDDVVVEEVRASARPLTGSESLDPLMERVGDARVVLLGEASHGTSEYYTWRARITQRLVEEKGFDFVAVEGDWPDCYRINRYVKAYPEGGENARQILHAFERWPTWMWANEEVVDLVEWMRGLNEGRAEDARVGFYGIDVYSLWESLSLVVDYLERRDPDAAAVARRAFACFEPYGEDAQEYARATLVPEDCEDEVVRLLGEFRGRAPEHAGDGEAGFNAEQNAFVARNAERYYRTMVRGGAESWNVRDHHMTDTLERLLRHHGPDAKAVVWEHNTHVGDARATDMASDGMVNVGQLVRERRGLDDVVIVGFGSHRGSVVAGSAWGAPMRRMTVPEARAGSVEDLMHRAGSDDKLLVFGDVSGLAEAALDRDPIGNPAATGLLALRDHRAIGVVYDPAFERYGNYVPTVLPLRYDAFVYLDESRAVRPLHMVPRLEEVPETFPSGV